MRTKGSITQVVREARPGYILGEDGCLVAFDESTIEGLDPRDLSIGDWVEYEETDPLEGRRASRVKPMIQRAQE